MWGRGGQSSKGSLVDTAMVKENAAYTEIHTYIVNTNGIKQQNKT